MTEDYLQTTVYGVWVHTTNVITGITFYSYRVYLSSLSLNAFTLRANSGEEVLRMRQDYFLEM